MRAPLAQLDSEQAYPATIRAVSRAGIAAKSRKRGGDYGETLADEQDERRRADGPPVGLRGVA